MHKNVKTNRCFSLRIALLVADASQKRKFPPANHYKCIAKQQYASRTKNMHASNRLFYDAKTTQSALATETRPANMIF